MDFDDDGTLDFISGSYDPGDVYLFRGLGHGKYAPVKKILDETGTPLVHHPEELKQYEQMKDDPNADEDKSIRARVASFGSWASPVDWDGDGDLDMLIGSFGGNLYRRMNKGSRTEPVFARESIAVEADGKKLEVLGHCDPVPADWDGDGSWDLVVGASDGSVSWYRNVGSKEQPAFGPRTLLVEAKAEMKFLTQYLEPDESPSPGVRAQICVRDYDQDGRLDLLVGDYSSIECLRELDATEKAEFEELLRAGAELVERMQDDPEGAESKQTKVELDAIAGKKKRYLLPTDDEKQPPASFVWFYRRLATSASDVPGGLPSSHK